VTTENTYRETKGPCTTTVNIGDVALGVSEGETIANCERDCNSLLGCKAFLYEESYGETKSACVTIGGAGAVTAGD